MKEAKMYLSHGASGDIISIGIFSDFSDVESFGDARTTTTYLLKCHVQRATAASIGTHE